MSGRWLLISKGSSEEARVGPDTYDFLQQNANSQNIKRLLLIKGKIRHFKLMNLELFYVWEESGLNEIIPLICTLPI